MASKKPVVTFKASRDGGAKSYNVIKTFNAIYPQLRWVKFREIRGMTNEEYAAALKESAFYLHLDEISSWGTAPIEAFLCKTLVAGWDGVGGREYMNSDNSWLAPNGDIFGAAVALGDLVEAWIRKDIKDECWQSMRAATEIYTRKAERDSVIRAHTEYREERIKEVQSFIDGMS